VCGNIEVSGMYCSKTILHYLRVYSSIMSPLFSAHFGPQVSLTSSKSSLPNATICKIYITWYHLTHSPTFNYPPTRLPPPPPPPTPPPPPPPPPPTKSLIQHLGHQSGVLDPGTKLVRSTSTTRSAATLDTKTF